MKTEFEIGRNISACEAKTSGICGLSPTNLKYYRTPIILEIVLDVLNSDSNFKDQLKLMYVGIRD